MQKHFQMNANLNLVFKHTQKATEPGSPDTFNWEGLGGLQISGIIHFTMFLLLLFLFSWCFLFVSFQVTDGGKEEQRR